MSSIANLTLEGLIKLDSGTQESEFILADLAYPFSHSMVFHFDVG